MPRQTTTVSVFLASPADVQPEREIISAQIDRWNRVRGRDASVYFDLIRWETAVSAGFGSDGQQVVNEQVGLDYDVLIALFWSRIGTQTPRSASGSVEEYERAFQRRQGGENVEISFFFKDAPVSLSALDPDQITRLRHLQNQVAEQGAFYKQFRDDEGLRFEIDLLLDRLARHFAPARSQTDSMVGIGAPETSASPAVPAEDTANISSHADRGLLDVADDLQRHAEQAGAFLEEMTGRLDELTVNSNQVSRTLQELGRLAPLNPADTRPMIDRVSAGMNDFSAFLEAGLPSFSENTHGITDDIRALIDISYDFDQGREDMQQFEEMLRTLSSNMSGSVESFSELRSEVSSLQRMTSTFNASRRRLVRNLTDLIDTIQSSRTIVDQAIQELEALQ
jgi:methyl-accepting chemotaxis protein